MKSQIMRLYRAMPQGVRNVLANTSLARTVRRRFFESDTSLHDQYYTEEYFNYEFDVPSSREAPLVIHRALTERFHPSSVLDVGCGPGEFLKTFCDAGVEGHGVDLASAAIGRCRAKGLDVVQLDLTTVESFPWTADVVYSFEVAEHLPKSAAANFVRALTAAARLGVVISAAQPGQPGLCHINCQPKSYWIELFTQNRFVFDEATTTRWAEENEAAGRTSWYYNNLMVFYPEPTP